MLKQISTATSIALLSGCATMFNGTSQNLNVATINDKNISETRCSIRNEEGAWQAAPNSAVSIHRDGNDTQIQCENPQQTGTASVLPSFSAGYLVLDLILDACIISCVVDGISNSFYEYPQFVSVNMFDKAGAIFPPSKTSIIAPPAIENNININNYPNATKVDVKEQSAKESKETIIEPEYFIGRKGKCYTTNKNGRSVVVDKSLCQ